MNKSILVIDDDEGILDAVAMVLEEAGYDVQTCQNAKEVYTEIEKSMPDLILLDILLSGEDGREIYSHLKGNEKTKNISVIVISAHHNGKKSMDLVGSDDFLAKPFEREDLMRKVAKSTHG